MIKKTKLIFLLAVIILCSASANAGEQAIIIASQGKVETLYSGQTEWAPLKPGTALNPRDSIKTRDNSSVDIKLAGSVIRLKENSFVKLGDIEKQRDNIKITEIDLRKGKILATLTELSPDSKFNITSPVAVSGVRGTSFSVTILPDNSSTELRVVKGEVVFECKNELDKYIKVTKLTSSVISPWKFAEIGAEGNGVLSRKILGEQIPANASLKHLPITEEEYSSKFGALAKVTTERSARIDAYRKLAEIMHGTVIDSKTTLENYAIKNDSIRTTVKGVVKGAGIINTGYYSDGAISIDMKIKSKKIVDRLIPLTGDIFGSNYLASPEVIEIDDFGDYLEIIELNTND
ncbi:MAG: FecR domain-containing protein [Candidatus Omnitrophota bacterium]|nr:FecR domain-containing protein [Candidatus Omnitrophota bacterium]